MSSRRKPARSYLSQIYSRMSKAAQAGMRRLRGRANRAGSEHLAADALEFDFIEREARDILAAIERLRARDASEAMPPITEYASEPMLPVEPYELAEPYEAPPATMVEYGPETMASANHARGRRRRRNAAGAAGGRTYADIRKLWDEALEHDDIMMVAICELAMFGELEPTRQSQLFQLPASDQNRIFAMTREQALAECDRVLAEAARGRRRRNAAGGRGLRYLATYRHGDGSVSRRWFDDPAQPAYLRKSLAASSVQQAITDGAAIGGMVEEYRGDRRVRQYWATR